MRYHGNYCGPNWSAGKYQPSVVDHTVPPVDEFDATCLSHDASYAKSEDLLEADFKFAKENFGRGPKRTIAATLVGIQGGLRALDKTIPKIFQTKTMSKTPKLRGAMTKLGPTPSPNTKHTGATVAVAASYGKVMRRVDPVITRTTNTARIKGRDFIGSVECTGITTFGLGKVAMLSPAYLQGAFLGNLARSFEKYKFTQLRVHYVPKVGTTANGQVVLCSQHSVSEPALQPESATFLNRAMTQGNAVFGPLWLETYIDIDCTDDYKLVDPATTMDPDDAIHEELQVYTQSPINGQVGYLWIDYDVSFKDPIYQIHSTSIPIYTGPGMRVQFNDANAANAADAFTWWIDSSALLNAADPVGSIYRVSLDITSSLPQDGTTFTNALKCAAYYHSALTTTSATSVNFSLVGGTSLYLQKLGTGYAVYLTLEAAATGNSTGQLIQRTVATSAGYYSGDVVLIRYGPTISATQQ